MGVERTALPTSWGRIGPEWLNLTVPPEGNQSSPSPNSSAWTSLPSPKSTLTTVG